MSFIKSLRSEILKNKGTSVWYVSGLLEFFIPCILIVEYSIHENTQDKVGLNPWNILIRDGFLLFNVVILPLYTLLITTLSPQVEYRNNTWKQVLTSPQSFTNIWVGRYVNIILMIVLFAITQALMLIITGLAIGLIFPAYGMFDHPIQAIVLVTSTCKSIVCVLGMSSALFWLGMRSKNFIIPLVVGFLIWIVSSTTTFDQSVSINLNPFSYLMFASFAEEGASITLVAVYSIAWCAVFLMLGLLEFKLRCPQLK